MGVMNELIELMLQCRPEEGPELDEVVGEFSESTSWEKILLDSYALLSDTKYIEYWHDAICIFCWAATDGISSPIENTKVVARLYWCASIHDALGKTGYGDNLVWSTTIALMNICYMSDWQPLEEPVIKELINEFNQKNS